MEHVSSSILMIWDSIKHEKAAAGVQGKAGQEKGREGRLGRRQKVQEGREGRLGRRQKVQEGREGRLGRRQKVQEGREGREGSKGRTAKNMEHL